MKMKTVATATLLAVALAACTGNPAPGSEAGAAPATDTQLAQPRDLETPPPATPADGAADVTRDVDGTRAGFAGVGPARFGMTAEEVRAAWSGALDGQPAVEGMDCYHLMPAGQAVLSDFALMFVDGGFVRYSVEGNDAITAPGGGRVGMELADIERLYGPDLQRSGHKYVEGGEYLRIADPDGGDAMLVFETDANGTVTGWRAGVPPQVDYVEGCA